VGAKKVFAKGQDKDTAAALLKLLKQQGQLQAFVQGAAAQLNSLLSTLQCEEVPEVFAATKVFLQTAVTLLLSDDELLYESEKPLPEGDFTLNYPLQSLDR